LARAREAARRASCQNNLKQLGLVFKMFASESQGEIFPSTTFLNCAPGATIAASINSDFIVDGMDVHPDYLTDPMILVCPSAPGQTGTVETQFTRANNLAEVIISSDYVLATDAPKTAFTSGVPNQDFYGCEVRTSSSDYIYTGYVSDLVGVTDQQDLNFSGIDRSSAGAAAAVGQFVGTPWISAIGLLAGISFAKDDANLGGAKGSRPKARLNNVSVPANATTLLGLPAMPNALNLLKLREGAERFLITDVNNAGASARAQSSIWVIADAVDVNVGEFNHIPGGANVLYMDGHVEFIRFPGKWPVNFVFAALNNQNWF
jgi:prepilin-type processing-associated H-X9-DG protein